MKQYHNAAMGKRAQNHAMSKFCFAYCLGKKTMATSVLMVCATPGGFMPHAMVKLIQTKLEQNLPETISSKQKHECLKSEAAGKFQIST